MQFVDLASQFSSAITVYKGGEEPGEADGKSVMQMIILAATEGTPLRIEADGEDAGRRRQTGRAGRREIWRRIEPVSSVASYERPEGAAQSAIARQSTTDLQRSMEIKKGIGVSPGVVISTAVVLDAEDLLIPKRYVTADQVESEISRFNESVAVAIADVSRLRNHMSPPKLATRSAASLIFTSAY